MFELSPEIEIHWAGMRSNTRTMQRHGWEFAVQNDYGLMMHRTCVIARHRRLGAKLIGYIDTDHLMSRHYRGVKADSPIIMDGAQIAQTVVMHGSADFGRVDMIPSIDANPARDPFSAFTPWADDAEEIIVDPPTVANLLEQIRSLQEPELAEIRKRNRQREYRAGDQREVVRAQILTLAA